MSCLKEGESKGSQREWRKSGRKRLKERVALFHCKSAWIKGLGAFFHSFHPVVYGLLFLLSVVTEPFHYDFLSVVPYSSQQQRYDWEDLSGPLLPPRGLGNSGVTSYFSHQQDPFTCIDWDQPPCWTETTIQYNNQHTLLKQCNIGPHLLKSLVCPEILLVHFSAPSIKATWVRQKLWSLQRDELSVSKLPSGKEFLAPP